MDPFAAGLLDEIARICGWRQEKTELPEMNCRVFVYGRPAEAGSKVSAPWSPMFGGRFQVARDGNRELHLFLSPDQLTPRQLLWFRRAVSFFPLAGAIESGEAALMHGAFVTRPDGCGFLLCGDSGAGKSTSFQRLPDSWEKHCDDAVLVVRKNDAYYGHPLPTWTRWLRKFSPVKYRGNTAIPVHRIYLLDHGNRDQVEKISPMQQMLGVVRCILHLQAIVLAGMPREEALRLQTAAFHFAREMQRRAPVLKLNVNLTGKFWEEFS